MNHFEIEIRHVFSQQNFVSIKLYFSKLWLFIELFTTSKMSIVYDYRSTL